MLCRMKVSHSIYHTTAFSQVPSLVTQTDGRIFFQKTYMKHFFLVKSKSFGMFLENACIGFKFFRNFGNMQQSLIASYELY